MPPNRTTPPPNPNAPIFGESAPSNSTNTQSRYFAETHTNKRQAPVNVDATLVKRQHSGDNLQNPPYGINNAFPYLSDRTASVNSHIP